MEVTCGGYLVQPAAPSRANL